MRMKSHGCMKPTEGAWWAAAGSGAKTSAGIGGQELGAHIPPLVDGAVQAPSLALGECVHWQPHHRHRPLGGRMFVRDGIRDVASYITLGPSPTHSENSSPKH